MAKKDKIYSLQALRGIAALMIVVDHAYLHLEARNIISQLPHLVTSARAGVDIFFVISGFVMVYIGEGGFGKAAAAKDFIIRRIIRIAPMYWLYTLLMVGIMSIYPHLVSQGKSLSIAHIFASLFFIPWHNSIGEVRPVLGVGWTLNFEMYFYCVFSLLLLFKKELFIPIITAILLGGLAIGLTFDINNPIFHVATSPLLVEFLLGCIIGVWYKRGVSIPSYICVLLIMFGAGILIGTGMYDADSVHRSIQWGLPGAILVGGTVFLERNGHLAVPAFLTSLGDSSYSLYLSHIFAISALGKLWLEHIDGMYNIFLILAVIFSIIVGHLAYRIAEKPLTTYLNNAYRNSSYRVILAVKDKA